MSTQIYLVTAEHFSVPGIKQAAHATPEGAARAAAALARMIRDDHVETHGEGCPAIEGDDYAAAMKYLQQRHGTICYVDVTTLALQP